MLEGANIKISGTITDIPGIGNTSTQAIISVIRTDMGRFLTDAHISSWDELCPGDNESAHRGKKRAYFAVAHSMLIAIYHILKDGVVFKDLGADLYDQFNKERKINAYLKKLKAFGWEAPVVAI